MTKSIPLSRGLSALVDDEDFDWLNQWKWNAAKFKGRSINYARRMQLFPFYKTISMHRLIMNASDGVFVDHINGNGLDNRRCNLRLCNNSENLSNKGKQKNNTSGYKGVSFHKTSRKFCAKICHKRKQMNLGYYDTPEEAARAYDRAAKKFHGDFAFQNFPN